jgi:hypothetical protein
LATKCHDEQMVLEKDKHVTPPSRAKMHRVLGRDFMSPRYCYWTSRITVWLSDFWSLDSQISTHIWQFSKFWLIFGVIFPTLLSEMGIWLSIFGQHGECTILIEKQGSAQDCWSAYIFSTKFKKIMRHFALFHAHIQNILGRVVAFFAEWWSGPTSAKHWIRSDTLPHHVQQKCTGLGLRNQWKLT